MTGDYLTTSTQQEQCVWCHAHVPAGQPLELIVQRDNRRWYSCATCAAETRAGAKETER